MAAPCAGALCPQLRREPWEHPKEGPWGKHGFPHDEAGGRVRTYDLDAGSAALCQLSYTRKSPHRSAVPILRP